MSDSSPGPLRRFSERLLAFGAYEGEDADQAGRRRVMVGALWYSIPFVALAGLGVVGFWMGVAIFAKPLAHALALVMLKLFPRSFRPAFRMVFSADLVSDLAVTFLLGGLFASGLQVGWSLIVVLGALVAFSVREAAVWFVVFVVAVVVSVTGPLRAHATSGPSGIPSQETPTTLRPGGTHPPQNSKGPQWRQS